MNEQEIPNGNATKDENEDKVEPEAEAEEASPSLITSPPTKKPKADDDQESSADEDDDEENTDLMESFSDQDNWVFTTSSEDNPIGLLALKRNDFNESPTASTSKSAIESDSEDQMKVDPNASPFEYLGELNPLEISNIVLEIFRYLSIKSIKNCRVVSPNWNQEACGLLQYLWPVTFAKNSSITDYLQRFTSLNKYPKPHVVYQMYGIKFSSGNQILKNFFSKFGDQIKVLNLNMSGVEFSRLEEVLQKDLTKLESLWLRYLPIELAERRSGKFRGVCTTSPSKSRRRPNFRERFSICQEVIEDSQEEIRKECRNLQKFVPQPGPSSAVISQDLSTIRRLTIGTRDLNFFESTEEEELPYVHQKMKLLTRTLALFPNLERITLSGIDIGIHVLHCKNMTKGIIRMPPHSLDRLRELYFPLIMTNTYLTGFINLGTKFLNDLEIILFEHLERNLLVQFFKMINTSLTKLSLTFAKTYNYEPRQRFLLDQDFSKLKELKLRRFRWNLSFLEFMPALETLVLTDIDLARYFPISLPIMSNLKTLREEREGPTVVEEMDSEVLARIVRAFPGLTELRFFGATDACLRILYFDMPYLKVLELLNGNFTDSGVTGVTQDVCIDLAETMSYDRENGDKLRGDLFIGNLNRIEKVKLESDKICELAVLFGTNKCPHLKSLFLKSARITDLSVKKILDRFDSTFIHLDVSECPMITVDGMKTLIDRLGKWKTILDAPLSVERLVYMATRRHRYLDQINRSLGQQGPRRGERGTNGQEPEEVAPPPENLKFNAAPFPREYAHRRIFELDDYNQQPLASEPAIPGHIINLPAQAVFDALWGNQEEQVEVPEDEMQDVDVVEAGDILQNDVEMLNADELILHG